MTTIKEVTCESLKVDHLPKLEFSCTKTNGSRWEFPFNVGCKPEIGGMQELKVTITCSEYENFIERTGTVHK